ncbi:glycosyltransferase [Patescibacteria group bacterium]|nr:glycosyltransferase [Patescibacteria group bacterium]MBU1906758.1 glycosyltransferase [Patescibacteria group bacterium]
MLPKLSIVIPTKDEEEDLPVLLASLKSQTVQPYEIIVADASSTDRTVEIAQMMGCKVVPGGMPGPGRNRGAEAATGEYLLFLDADVELLDERFLEDNLAEMVAKGYDFACPDVEPIEGTRFDRFSHEAYNRYCRLIAPLHQHAPGFCIFVKKAFHDKLGGFDETVTFCEDHEYAMRAAKAGRYGFLSKPVPVSIRRFDRDSRLGILIKYLLAELHHWFIGPIRHDKFKYTFGHKKKDK